jgi:hypothetical protein
MIDNNPFYRQIPPFFALELAAIELHHFIQPPYQKGVSL